MTRMCNVCGRVSKAPKTGGGGIKRACNPKRPLPEGGCPGHMKCAVFIGGKYQIRRHN